MLHGKQPFCIFEFPFGGLQTTYDVHLRLIEKHIGDFLLVLIELFCYVVRLRRYEQIWIENRSFLSNRLILTKNFRCKGSPHQLFFFSEN